MMMSEALLETVALSQHLSNAGLFGPTTSLPWQVATAPYPLSAAQQQDLHRLGPVLFSWVQALDLLYRGSLKGSQPTFIADWLNQGKPQALLQFSQMNRFKNALPRLLRPDLLWAEENPQTGQPGWVLCELDAVPGGLGFLMALHQAYSGASAPLLGSANGQAMAQTLAHWLKSYTPDVETPSWAVVVSDESEDYRAEQGVWVNAVQQASKLKIAVIHPKQVRLRDDRLGYLDEKTQHWQALDGIYRFWELFDQPNVPGVELIQFAAKKGWVQVTAPFKPHLEEKLALALLHMPVLAEFWQQHLGEADYQWLKTIVAPTWVLDPTPLPPQASIHGLSLNKQALQGFEALGQASQKQRQWVIKPSGFSPLAWGSRGVTVGHDVSQEAWQAALTQALSSFGQTPYVLQPFAKPAVVNLEILDPQIQAPKAFEGRLRVCPYYVVPVNTNTPELLGALVTACPKDKKVIHGMSVATMLPAAKAT